MTSIIWYTMNKFIREGNHSVWSKPLPLGKYKLRNSPRQIYTHTARSIYSFIWMLFYAILEIWLLLIWQCPALLCKITTQRPPAGCWKTFLFTAREETSVCWIWFTSISDSIGEWPVGLALPLRSEPQRPFSLISVSAKLTESMMWCVPHCPPASCLIWGVDCWSLRKTKLFTKLN